MPERQFEWDREKSGSNYRKHGIDFETASEAFDDRNRDEDIDDREDYGEVRMKLVGMVRGYLIAVIYTERGDVTRIISARPATRKETDEYYSRHSQI